MTLKDSGNKPSQHDLVLGMELKSFEGLQARLMPLFRDIVPDRKAPHTVVILPSMSFDEDVLSRVKGVYFYEERMLCLLMLLRSPLTKIIFITSMPIHDSIVDYYLHLLPGRLKEKGVLNVFSVDFISVKSEGIWKHYAIEINLRKGGTTFPYMSLKFLTDGLYDAETGLYRLQGGKPRYYYASDNLHDDRYKGLSPDDIIDIMVYNGIHFDGASQTGVVFHLLGAIHDYGKFGVTCIGESRNTAKRFYQETIAAMDQAIKS